VRTEERGGRRYVTETHYIAGDIVPDDHRKIAAHLRQIIASENNPPAVRPGWSGYSRVKKGREPWGEDPLEDEIQRAFLADQWRRSLGRPQQDKAGDPPFYAALASRYQELVQTTHTPSRVIADEEGVPLATVQRWVRKARQMGFLPPARKGAAG
jgi:hypothetical protein